MGRSLYLFFYQHGKGELPGVTAKQHREALRQWEWIEKEIKKLPIPQRAYFDSLHKGRYNKIMNFVRFAVDQNAPRTLMRLPSPLRAKIELIRRGVIIEYAEDRSLMTEYRTLAKQKGYFRKPSIGDSARYYEILDKRDRFIAERIHKTLREGETGFLFQGANHSIYPFLEADIRIGVYLGYLCPRQR